MLVRLYVYIPVVLLSRVQWSVYPVMSPLQLGIGIIFHWNMAEKSSSVRSTETEGGGTEDIDGRENGR